MNQTAIPELIDKALTRKGTFPEILAALLQEEVGSYHVDFLRNEYRYYARSGESFLTKVALVHDGVAAEFSAERLEALSKRVQSGQAAYPDFVREGTAAGCAYYIVYLHGEKVRYFGRDGEEYIQYFPSSR
jgi:uncharacterized protein YbcV (DUF1398 family)